MSISRSRGYAFENYVVHELRKRGWLAKRFGGATVEFPDILGINNIKNILLSIECKATSKKCVDVPWYQVDRCFELCDFFGRYEQRIPIFAFKFRGFGGRKLQYYYKTMPQDLYDRNKNKIKVTCYENGLCKAGEEILPNALLIQT